MHLDGESTSVPQKRLCMKHIQEGSLALVFLQKKHASWVCSYTMDPMIHGLQKLAAEEKRAEKLFCLLQTHREASCDDKIVAPKEVSLRLLEPLRTRLSMVKQLCALKKMGYCRAGLINGTFAIIGQSFGCQETSLLYCIINYSCWKMSIE